MAFPVADSYSCDSGGVIAAGRFVIGPDLSGSMLVFALSPTSYTAAWPHATDAVEYQYRLNAGAWISVGTAVYVSLTGRTSSSTDLVEVRAIKANGARSPILSKLITLPWSGAPIVIARTIGIGGDYTTMQQWNDDAPTELDTANQVWEGWCLNQVHTATYPAHGVTLAGSRSDIARYKHLTAHPGMSFQDHANRRSNPLRYNASVGACISVGTQIGVEMDEGYCKVSRLMIRSIGNGTTGFGGAAIHSSSPTYPVTIENCILESGSYSFILSQNYGAHVTRNCIVISTMTAAQALVTPPVCLAEMNNGSQNFNTIFTSTDVRYPKATVARTTNTLFRNSGFFGVDLVHDLSTTPLGNGSPVYDHCFSDAPGTLPDGVTFATLSSIFESTVSGSHDFRLKSGSPLINAGVADATTSTDITGKVRTSQDVGPWEAA